MSGLLETIADNIKVQVPIDAYYVGLSSTGRDAYEPEFGLLMAILGRHRPIELNFFTRPGTRLLGAFKKAQVIKEDMFNYRFSGDGHNLFFLPRPGTDYIGDGRFGIDSFLQYASILSRHGVDTLIGFDLQFMRDVPKDNPDYNEISSLRLKQLETRLTRETGAYDVLHLFRKKDSSHHYLVKF